MNVVNETVSRNFLSEWIQVYESVLTPQVRRVTRKNTNWILGFVNDVLSRNPDSQEIPLKGRQINVVEEMGDNPIRWNHWALIENVKGKINAIEEEGENLSNYSSLCDALASIFIPNPSAKAIEFAEKILRKHEQKGLSYEQGSDEFLKCAMLINHLTSLSPFYWARKGATSYKVHEIQSLMNRNKFVFCDDFEFILSLNKAKVSLWNLAEKEIQPGVLIKVKSRNGEIGIVLSNLTYSKENTEPDFLVSVAGVTTRLTPSDYSPIKRRKKEKKIA